MSNSLIQVLPAFTWRLIKLMPENNTIISIYHCVLIFLGSIK